MVSFDSLPAVASGLSGTGNGMPTATARYAGPEGLNGLRKPQNLGTIVSSKNHHAALRAGWRGLLQLQSWN